MTGSFITVACKGPATDAEHAQSQTATAEGDRLNTILFCGSGLRRFGRTVCVPGVVLGRQRTTTHTHVSNQWNGGEQHV